MAHFVGIDWAMTKHDICIQTEDGRIVSECVIAHSMEGFQQLAHLLEALDEVHIVLERSDGLLVDWLLQQSWSVYMIHPSVLNHRRPRRSKDDRGDAYLLAYLLRVKDPDCRLVSRSSPLVQQLKQAATAYDNALMDERRYGNRLKYLLRQYYPQVIHAFPSTGSLTCLTFLETYPTPQQGKSVSMSELEAFLAEQRYSARQRQLPRIYAGLQADTPSAAYPEAYVFRLKTLIPQFRCAIEQRKRCEKQLVTLFKQHPEADWWQGFPGVGDLTGARLLAYIGDDRTRFPRPDVLQAVAGTAPVTRRSGKQVKVEFRKACAKPLRKTAVQMARNSIRDSGWARSYYHEQLARGHAKSRAFRALANRWLAIVWKLWQTNEIYDEAIHLANRSHRGKNS
jgi:transposase